MSIFGGISVGGKREFFALMHQSSCWNGAHEADDPYDRRSGHVL